MLQQDDTNVVQYCTNVQAWVLTLCFITYRAKKIQNKAVVNESPTDRLIRELKEENARLLAALKKQGVLGVNSDGNVSNQHIVSSSLSGPIKEDILRSKGQDHGDMAYSAYTLLQYSKFKKFTTI